MDASVPQWGYSLICCLRRHYSGHACSNLAARKPSESSEDGLHVLLNIWPKLHLAPEMACEIQDDMVYSANPASGAACLH